MRCPQCGQEHDLSETEVNYGYPDEYFFLEPAQRARRGRAMTDWCMLDGRCFLRGSIRVPIKGEEKDFVWGVWVEVRRYVFERYLIMQAEEGPSKEPLYEGTLSNELPSYTHTLGLRMRMEFTGDFKRPVFSVIPQDHPLSIDQREGISFDRVIELMSPIWHPEG